jgi:O-antigen/teichoic acid export membrane protein
VTRWQRLTERLLQPHRETITHFTWRILQLAGKEGVNFVIFLVAAKFLAPYVFGIYNYVLAAIFLLIIIGDFGISVAASKFIAEYRAVSPERAELVLANGGIIIIVLSAVIIFLTVIWGDLYLKQNHGPTLYALPLVFLVSATSLYDGVYRGLKRFEQLGKISLLASLPALGLVYPLVARHGLIGALMAQNVYYFGLLIGMAVGYRDFRLHFDAAVCRKIVAYAGIIGLIHVSFFLYTRADILVLGAFDYIVEIGYYEIVNKLIMIIAFPFLAFAQIKAPDIVARFYTRGHGELTHIFRRYLRYAILFACLFAAGTAVAMPFILKHFFVVYYTSAVLTIAYLFLAIYVFDVVGNFMGNTFIISTGHAWLNMINIVVFGVANVLADILFVQRFGFMGIAYAKFFVVILGSISILFFYYQVLRRESAVGPGRPSNRLDIGNRLR